MNENFVNLHIDKDKYEQLAEKFKVGGIPDTLFITPEGRIITRIIGYMPAAEFLAELKKVPDIWKQLTDLEAAVAKDEKNAQARFDLARILASGGDLEGAEKQLRAVIELDKDNAKGLALESWWALAEATLGTDEPDIAKAKEALGKVQELDAKNEKGRADNAAVKLAEILMDSDPKGSKAVFEKVIADYPKTDGAGEAMFMLGAWYANIEGNFDAAAAQMKKLAEEMPDSEWAKRVPRALEQIEKMKNAPK